MLIPSVGKKNAKAGFEYKQANLFTRSSVDLFKGPTINTDAVVGYQTIRLLCEELSLSLLVRMYLMMFLMPK
jgi:hypothetical protein